MPGSNGLRNRLFQINPLFDTENDLNEVLLWDEAVFVRVRVAKGLVRFLPPDLTGAITEKLP